MASLIIEGVEQMTPEQRAQLKHLLNIEEPAAARSADLLTVLEVAAHVKRHPETVRRACRSGALPAQMLGSEWRVTPESVDAWLTAPQPRNELKRARRRNNRAAGPDPVAEAFAAYRR